MTDPRAQSEGFAAAIVAPTYNNDRTLVPIIVRLLALPLPLIIVNDGSTDSTGQLLVDLKRHYPHLIVLRHARNYGKAAAMLTGFRHAWSLGFTHAITIDTDDQHDPEDVPGLLAKARADPRALILGVRSLKIPGYPARSMIGRRISNFLVWLESGARVQDSQSGLRIYPLELLTAVHCHTGRYSFETEILTRAAWAGTAILEVPITSRYLPPSQRISHFRPWCDSVRSLGLHLRLLGRTLVPWRSEPRWPVIDPALAAPVPPRWRRLLNWLSPAEMWRQLRQSRVEHSRIAAGFAIGVLIATLPLYPFQTLIGLYTARRLHMHPLSVVAGAHVSTPPVGPLMIAASIALGRFMRTGTWPALDPDVDASLGGLMELAGTLLGEWVIGSVVLGTVLMLLAYGAVLALLRLMPVHDEAV